MNALIIGMKPGEKPPTAPGGKPSVMVPLSALSIDGEEPKAGDAVDFQASGKVLQVMGEHARVEIESVEGQPVGADEPEPEGEKPFDDERAELGDMAAKEDGE